METFGDVLRRVRGRPLTLLTLLVVVVPLVGIGVAFVPQPFQSAPGAVIGIPAAMWILRRDQLRRAATSAKDDAAEGS
ncbi:MULTISPECIES: hypothetical protein [Streptacidiphilus]|uniref:hypothetical protein n=1 Tax=Streptacidiphilus TaxID=228398 RepID=UPI0004C0EC6B|nr:hypothetical protein [Streptacidiphilus jeojiense]